MPGNLRMPVDFVLREHVDCLRRHFSVPRRKKNEKEGQGGVVSLERENMYRVKVSFAPWMMMVLR